MRLANRQTPLLRVPGALLFLLLNIFKGKLCRYIYMLVKINNSRVGSPGPTLGV